MAIAQKQVASFANGSVRAEVDWNTANGKILRGRVYNESDEAAYMYCKLDPPVGGWDTVGLTAPAHTTTPADFPNNVVSYTKITDPATGDIDRAKATEYRVRWRVTDSGGKISFFPKAAAERWLIST